MIKFGKQINFGALDDIPYKTRKYKIGASLGDFRRTKRIGRAWWSETLTGIRINRTILNVPIGKWFRVYFIHDDPAPLVAS